MNNLIGSFAGLCAFAVMVGVVSFLLPRNGTGDTVRSGSKMLLLILAIGLLCSMKKLDWHQIIKHDSIDLQSADEYVSNRLSESLCDAVEKEANTVLQQFGITDGQIRIDCTKGKHGYLELDHILVYIPKEYAEKRVALKQMLLDEFDVFCDVSVEEGSCESG